MQTTPTREAEGGSSSELTVRIGPFIESLRAAGYAPSTLDKRRRAATSFGEWFQRERSEFEHPRGCDVEAFLARPECRSKHRLAEERAGVRAFLLHFKSAGDADRCNPTSAGLSPETLVEGYTNYLRHERGLAERSIAAYLPFVGGFVEASRVETVRTSLDARFVRTFLLEQVEGRSGAYARLLSSALRSFLGFLFLRGETAVDLSLAVPAIRRMRDAQPQALLSAADVERIVATADPTTPGGRRDRAILLLLARLGLRAGEVVGLELDDFYWRSAEIVVRGKGRRVDRLPLPDDVGEAVSLHLERDRGNVASRRIFLRMIAPRVGLSGPAAVGHVVRAALVRAGVRKSGRGAAHLLRHCLATTMIRHGATLSEISEILRHRNLATTETYAKVDFEALRRAAQPWPGAEVGT